MPKVVGVIWELPTLLLQLPRVCRAVIIPPQKPLAFLGKVDSFLCGVCKRRAAPSGETGETLGSGNDVDFEGVPNIGEFKL